MAVPLSFLHSPVILVGKPVGLTNSYTGLYRQDRPVDLFGGVNSLTGESCHDLVAGHHCSRKKSA